MIIKPFIDKIAVLLDVELVGSLAAVNKTLDGLFAAQSLGAAHATQNYHRAYRIKLLHTVDADPFLQVKYSKEKISFRLELSPPKVTGSDLMVMHNTLQQIVDGGWKTFLVSGRHSMLEISADIMGITMSEFHVVPSKLMTQTTWKTKAGIETIVLGDPKAKQRLRIYDRSNKRKKKKNQIYPQSVRFERILKQIGKLSDLQGPDNPFLGFDVVTLPQSPPNGVNDAEIWPLFCDSAELHGMNQALVKLQVKRRTRYKSWLKQHLSNWWQPNDLWNSWPDYLAKSKLFNVSEWP